MHCPNKWYNQSTQAQHWYNSSYYSAIKTTSFQALYVYPPNIKFDFFAITLVAGAEEVIQKKNMNQ